MWSSTKQNIVSDFRIFIDTGYFPGDFESIFVCDMLKSSFIGSFTLFIFVSFQQNMYF